MRNDQHFLGSTRMIDILSYVFVILGALLLMVGYWKTHRNLMLVGAVFLTLSGGMNEFATGFSEAFHKPMSGKLTETQ
jgi:hypothetical protein